MFVSRRVTDTNDSVPLQFKHTDMASSINESGSQHQLGQCQISIGSSTGKNNVGGGPDPDLSPRIKGPPRNKNHACTNSNLRRQNGGEGDEEEMTSLLYNDVMATSGLSPSISGCCDTVDNDCDTTAHSRTTRHPDGIPSPPGGDRRGELTGSDVDSSPEVAGPSGEDTSRDPKGGKGHRLAKERADTLKRELARIQRELKSLGELELEISYV